ncbi:MAG: hypothetical protein KDB84_08230, partial [Flavobacteriales bacterium]|nr:hypothetical protein [Flavobacteriales bacterium]
MASFDRLRFRLDRVLRITIIWLIVGSIAALFEHNTLRAHGQESMLWERLDARLLNSLVAGLFGGGIYIFLVRDKLRRLPFLQAFGVVAASLFVLMALFHLFAPWNATSAGRTLDLGFLGHYLYWTLLMGASIFMVRLNDQYGSGGIGYLTGRYHKPRQEMRVFMFLDMRSST